MAVTMHPGKMPHIYWIDLSGDGVFTESAVMKQDGNGNVFFFPLNSLDNIDKGRLAKIISNRNSTHFELWDLMSNMTLNNGVNALSYYHQLVEVITPTGKRMKPREGVIGTEIGVVDTRGKDARKQVEENAQIAANAAATAAAAAATAAVRAEYAQPTAAPAPAPAPKKTTRSTTKKPTSPAE